LAPYLNDRQLVLLTPGTLGSYAMARTIARADGTLPLAFAETGTLPYLARKTAPTVVKAPVRAANLPVGVFPASRSAGVLPRVARGRGALRCEGEDEARGERPLERDPHVRAPLRHRRRGPRALALRIGGAGGGRGDARHHRAPPRVRRPARARAVGRRPRA